MSVLTGKPLTAFPLTARPLTARALGEGEAAAAFSIAFTGLTDSEARIGDHAGIGYTIDPDNGTETVAWGNSPDDDTYGTGANPADFTAGDEGQLWLSVTDGGETVRRSAPIRYAAGTAPAIADGQSWTVDDTSVSLDGSASGSNLTFTYSLAGEPAGISVNSSTGLITGTPTAVDSGTITVTATDQYNRSVSDTFTFANTLRTAATAASGLGPYSFAIDSAITPVSVATDFTLNGNTLTYTISPALPTGLSMSSAGSITGTPTALSASSSYTVTGQDEYGRDTTSTFDVAVVEDTGFGDDLVIVARTTTASETFEIEGLLTDTYSATIDWGDGSTSTITAWNDSDLSHVYAVADDYTIKISGTFESFAIPSAQKSKIRKVLNIGDTGLTSLDSAFNLCPNIDEFDLSNGNTNTSAVTTMRIFLTGASSIPSLDLTPMDVSSNTSLLRSFQQMSSLTSIDVSNWDTSSVTDMRFTFLFCSSLTSIDISGWDITALTTATDFLSGANSALTTAEYDAVLVAWEAQAYNNNVPIHFGDATYTSGSAAATARAQLVTDGWTITDGGTA